MQKKVREPALQGKGGDHCKTGKYVKILCN